MSSKKQTAKYNFMNETMYQLKVLRTLTPSRRQGGREKISSFPFLLATREKVVDSARERGCWVEASLLISGVCSGLSRPCQIGCKPRNIGEDQRNFIALNLT